MGKLPEPRFVKDMGDAMRPARPHRLAEKAASSRAAELRAELQDPAADLDANERATKQEEVGRLRDEVLRERAVVEHLLMDDLNTRLPGWLRVYK